MSGTVDANGIAVSENLLYVTRTANGSTKELNIIQNTGTSAYAIVGDMNYTSTLYDIVLRNTNYAYVTTANTAAELLVVDISNSAAPVVSSTINLPASLTGRYNLAMSGNYLIIYKSTGTVTGMSIYIYDCTNPALPTLAGSFALPSLVYDVDVDPARSLIFVVSATTTAEFRVIDYTNPAIPVLRGLYNAPATTYRSVAWDSANDRIYIGTTDNTNEIVVLDNN